MHVEFAFRDRAIIRVYDQEEYHLPDVRPAPASVERSATTPRCGPTPCRRWTRRSIARSARTRVHAAFGLLNSVADFTPVLGDRELAHQLHTMTTAGLLAPTGDPAQTLRR